MVAPLRNPFDFDFDAALSMAASAVAGVVLSCLSCNAPGLSAKAWAYASASLGFGGWAVAQSFVVNKSSQRTRQLENVTEILLEESLEREYLESQPEFIQQALVDSRDAATSICDPDDFKGFLDFNDPRKREVFNKLNNPQHCWILTLLMASPLALVGKQAAGKTTFVGFLTLLRKAILDIPIQTLDPHADTNEWPPGFNPIGHNQDWGMIQSGLAEFRDRMKNAKGNQHDRRPQHQMVVDELSTYAQGLTSDKAKELLTYFGVALTADISKKGELVTLLTHGWTKQYWGNIPGISEAKAGEFVRLDLGRTRNTAGAAKPRLDGILYNLYDDPETGEPLSVRVYLETWMRPEWVLERFPELRGENHKPFVRPDDSHQVNGFELGKSPTDVEIVEDDQVPDFGADDGANRYASTEDINNLHHLWDKDCTDNTNPIPDGWIKRDPTLEPDEEVRSAVVRCVRCGWNQQKTCEAIWEVIKRGNCNRWKAATYWYKNIKEVLG